MLLFLEKQNSFSGVFGVGVGEVCTYLIKCILSVSVNEGSYMSRTLQYAM